MDVGPIVASIDRLVSSRRSVVIVGGVMGSAGFIIGSQSTTVLQLTFSIAILSGKNIRDLIHSDDLFQCFIRIPKGRGRFEVQIVLSPSSCVRFTFKASVNVHAQHIVVHRLRLKVVDTIGNYSKK